MTKEEIIQKGEKKFPPDIIEEISDGGKIVRTDVNATIRHAYIQGLIDNNCLLPSELDEAAKKIAYDVCKQLPNGTEKDSIVYYAILAAKAGAEWMAEQGVKIGETKIYLKDDGDEPPYSQEWLDLESTEFKLPDGAFQPGDEVEVILRKKQ